MKTWQRVAPCLLGLLCFVLVARAQNAAAPSAYDSVNPIIGTAGGGNTFPGASLPFGMIQWSPDTGPDAWYDYGQKRIYGFSLTHISGAGCPVYGDFPILPWSGDLTVSPHANRELYTQPFDHTNESAHPGYYALRRYGRDHQVPRPAFPIPRAYLSGDCRRNRAGRQV